MHACPTLRHTILFSLISLVRDKSGKILRFTDHDASSIIPSLAFALGGKCQEGMSCRCRDPVNPAILKQALPVSNRNPIPENPVSGMYTVFKSLGYG